MSIFKFTNNAVGALASGIGPADGTLALETGDGALFPALVSGEAFHILVREGSKSEWMTCTARSGDSLTVMRSGSPQSFGAGASVTHLLSAETLNQFLQKGQERVVTQDPDGSLAADYFGEEVYNSATGVWWKHCNGTVWKEMNL